MRSSIDEKNAPIACCSERDGAVRVVPVRAAREIEITLTPRLAELLYRALYLTFRNANLAGYGLGSCLVVSLNAFQNSRHRPCGTGSAAIRCVSVILSDISFTDVSFNFTDIISSFTDICLRLTDIFASFSDIGGINWQILTVAHVACAMADGSMVEQLRAVRLHMQHQLRPIRIKALLKLWPSGSGIFRRVTEHVEAASRLIALANEAEHCHERLIARILSKYRPRPASEMPPGRISLLNS